jgi:hypothetical protein
MLNGNNIGHDKDALKKFLSKVDLRQSFNIIPLLQCTIYFPAICDSLTRVVQK